VTTTFLETTRVQQLADRLEHDIRSRGFDAGDRYLTAVEAGYLLGVSKSTADRAMRILTAKGVLQRQRNRGSYIGASVDMKRPTAARVICGLMPESARELFNSGLLMQGICGQMSHVTQVFSHLPRRGSVEHAREVLKYATSGGAVAGVVAISCPGEVYAFLADCGLPSVVLGSLHPGEPVLPSVESDHRQSGRLLTRLLIDRGHRRIALMNPTEVRPGENDFFDGVSEVLTEAELPHNALLVRSIPHDPGPFCAAVREVFGLPNRPTAFIARYQRHAEMISSVVSELGLAVPEDIQIVFRGQAEQSEEQSAYPHTQPVRRVEQIGALVGDMLGQLAEGLPLDQQRVVIPVELRGPQLRPAAKGTVKKSE
jgi:DNA-binding LacI/PurR family transcriptional regulator/DNA-binding transcriptional regulator YhcF (GntR family)